MNVFFLLIIVIYFISSLCLIPYPLNLVYLAFKSRNWKKPLPKFVFSDEDLPSVAIHL